MKKFIYTTSIGQICICETNSKISHISFFDSIDAEIEETALIKETYKQLCEYLSKRRKNFDIPLHIEGSEFQIKVWKALQNIEYGKTASYGEIAKIINAPKAYRAVGNANNKNKIAIIIPCHRVIGVSGNLTGYAGGLPIKKYLLELEQG